MPHDVVRIFGVREHDLDPVPAAFLRRNQRAKVPATLAMKFSRRGPGASRSSGRNQEISTREEKSSSMDRMLSGSRRPSSVSTASTSSPVAGGSITSSRASPPSASQALKAASQRAGHFCQAHSQCCSWQEIASRLLAVPASPAALLNLAPDYRRGHNRQPPQQGLHLFLLRVDPGLLIRVYPPEGCDTLLPRRSRLAGPSGSAS